MIGLMFLAGIGLWLAVAILLSKKIPIWLGVTKYRAVISVLVFPVLFLAPVADEIVGRWQFSRLCEREAVVTLSPDWEKVKRAARRDIPSATLDGYLIRILTQRVEYFDIDTGESFLSIQAFHAEGGFLFYQLRLGLGGLRSCWPKDWIEVTNRVKTDQLIKQGKSK